VPIVCAGEHCVARSRPSGSRRDVLIVASRALPPSRLRPAPLASRTDGPSSWGGGDIQGFQEEDLDLKKTGAAVARSCCWSACDRGETGNSMSSSCRKLAGAIALAGLAATEAFAPAPAIVGAGRRSAGLALARYAPRPALRTAGGLRMGDSKVTTKEVDGVVEFMGVDSSGNPVTLTLAAREKLYLDATAAFHLDGSALIEDDDYDQLKNDLAFEGSKVGLMNRDEIKFMVLRPVDPCAASVCAPGLCLW